MWRDCKLEVVYEDRYFIAINKPSGLLVHKSLIDKKEIYFAMKILRDQIGAWVYPVHRLDKPTSGVLIFAKDKDSARRLSEEFASHNMTKTYIAVVRGYLDEGIINHPLSLKLDKIADKNVKEKEPQEASTIYKSLARVELDIAVGRYPKTRYSLVELKPKTGRKHQLRRHMKHLSHHIVGDTKYGRGEHNKMVRKHFECYRMLLHASTLEITHPYTKERLVIKADIDETFQSIFKSFGWEEIYKKESLNV